MEAIQSILNRKSNATIHTKTSVLQNYKSGNIANDCEEDTAVIDMITEASAFDFTKSVDVCEKCGDPRQTDKMIFGVIRRLPIICSCRKEELNHEKERDKYLALQRRLDKFKAYSLMDERFSESTFENWKFREDNRRLYDFGKRYCENWDRIYANNHGLLIHGIAGNGKTYLSFAIANELYKLGNAVIAISVSRILKVITDSYGQHGELGEVDVLNTLSEASLLILDDLGVEHKTNWSYEKLYSIIDTRYRAKKPTIITTNLAINELRENLAIVDIKSGRYDQSNRIYSRIVEMCSFIEVEGESWRIQKGAENKAALFSELRLTAG